MKINPEHYALMKEAVKAGIARHWSSALSAREQYYRAGNSFERFMWDMFHLAGLTKWTCDVLYPYCDDTHIATALRRVLHELIREAEDDLHKDEKGAPMSLLSPTDCIQLISGKLSVDETILTELITDNGNLRKVVQHMSMGLVDLDFAVKQFAEFV